jgi:hypothetical protein
MSDKILAFLKSFWLKIRYFFWIFLVMGLVMGYRKILLAMFVAQCNRIEAAAKAKDKSLVTDEEQVNSSADALTHRADELPKTENQVTDDWYKAKK